MNGKKFPKPYHTFSVGTALDHVKVDADQGLRSSEVRSRLTEFGPDELVEHGAKNSWRIMLNQYKENMVLVLIIAAIISALLSVWKNTIAIQLGRTCLCGIPSSKMQSDGLFAKLH